jgi:hypothetical protein
MEPLMFVVAMGRLHEGHDPSMFIADGARYLAHPSHQGIAVQSARFLTRILIGVEPNSNFSRMHRSK